MKTFSEAGMNPDPYLIKKSCLGDGRWEAGWTLNEQISYNKNTEI